MIDSKQDLTSEFGLKKILHLEEVISQRQLEEKNDTFLIDFRFGSETEAAIYPVTIYARIKKKLFRGDQLLFLSNSFWRYLAEVRNIEYLIKDEIGAFSKEYFFVENKASNKNNYDLWLFEPGTRGWEYYQKILLPKHQRDLFDVLDLANQ